MADKKKIVLIGPVYPYKGGISHYTGLMYQALSKKFEVVMLSYKMQYPKLLFKKEQRDYSNRMFQIEGTEYAIHTANPFNWTGVARKIKKLQPDLVLFQWWHPYFAPCYWWICKLLGRKIPKLFLCHNVFPHERFPMDKFLTRLTLKQGQYFIVQSTQDEEDLKSIRSSALYRKTVHPTYNAFKIQNLTKEEGRKQLQIEEREKVLLFFGFIREYKGLKHLICALPEVVSQVPDVKLLVVGDFSGEEEKERYCRLIKEQGVESVVQIQDGYIPDQEVEKFFAASDLVVLPYESATQSGIVQIAYGFEKPVVVTDVGGLPDVVSDGKTGYVVESRNSHALAEGIIRFFRQEQAQAFRTHIVEEADKYSWDRMTEIVEDLLKTNPKTGK
jgi:glycosyltransferase involved in cell wall biosynthesis